MYRSIAAARDSRASSCPDLHYYERRQKYFSWFISHSGGARTQLYVLTFMPTMPHYTHALLWCLLHSFGLRLLLLHLQSKETPHLAFSSLSLNTTSRHSLLSTSGQHANPTRSLASLVRAFSLIDMPILTCFFQDGFLVTFLSKTSLHTLNTQASFATSTTLTSWAVQCGMDSLWSVETNLSSCWL